MAEVPGIGGRGDMMTPSIFELQLRARLRIRSCGLVAASFRRASNSK